MAAAVERTIVIVETTEQAESVIIGAHGIIRGAKPGHIVLCMATIDPFAARSIADRLAAIGIAMLDAPVSGGTGPRPVGRAVGDRGRRGGGVRQMRGPVRRAWAADRSMSGALGSGLAMKLVNNMLVQVNTVAVAEAMVLGVKAGLDPKTIYEVVRVSTGASAAWELRVPRILAGDFVPGGTIDISYKDQELETAFAKRLGVPLLLANVTQQVYQMARAQGLNKQDGSAIVKVFEQMAGVTVKGERAMTDIRADPRRLSGRLDLEPGRRAPARRRAISCWRRSLDGCAERKGQVRAGITTETHAAEVAELLFYQDLKRRGAGRHQHRRHGDGARRRAGARTGGARGVRRCAGAARRRGGARHRQAADRGQHRADHRAVAAGFRDPPVRRSRAGDARGGRSSAARRIRSPPMHGAGEARAVLGPGVERLGDLVQAEHQSAAWRTSAARPTG